MPHKRNKRKAGVSWCYRGWTPKFFYGLAPTEKDFLAELKAMGVSPSDYPPFVVKSAACHVLLCKGYRVIVVTLNDENKKVAPINVVSCLTHEAVHVFEYLCDWIGEKEPSSEFRAYTIQMIVTELIAAYEAYRRKVFVGPKMEYDWSDTPVHGAR